MRYISIQTGLSYDFEVLARRENPRDEDVFWQGSIIDNDANSAYKAWYRNRDLAEHYSYADVYYRNGDFTNPEYGGTHKVAYGEYVFRQRCLLVFGRQMEQVKEMSVTDRIEMYRRNNVKVHHEQITRTHIEITSPSGFAEKVADYGYASIRGTELLVGSWNRGWAIPHKSNDEFFIVDAEAYELMCSS